jgi:hypothetical protein
VANPPGATGQKLSFAYFQRCVNPVLNLPLRVNIGGVITTNTCAAAGSHDNASGTAALLMTAKRLKEAYGAAPADQELRSVLFLAFDAEEMGLNGARHFVRNASIPADKVDVMLNMDMVGRIRDGTLVVGGVESAVGFRDALEPMFVDSGLKVFADPSGRAPSDHAPFFGAGIPVLFFFGGVHDIYHQPGDQGYTVDPRGIPALLDLVGRIADRGDLDLTGGPRAGDQTVVDDELQGARRDVRILAGVGVGDAAQRRLVIGEARAAGQRQHAGTRVPRAGDAGLVDEAEHVLPGDVAHRDAHRRADEG